MVIIVMAGFYQVATTDLTPVSPSTTVIETTTVEPTTIPIHLPAQVAAPKKNKTTTTVMEQQPVLLPETTTTATTIALNIVPNIVLPAPTAPPTTRVTIAPTTTVRERTRTTESDDRD
jgi:hypothetical protein